MTILRIFVLLSALVIAREETRGQETNKSPVPQPASNEIIPLIVLDEVPLTDVIKNLARQIGFNFILDPHVPGSPTGPGSRISQPVIRGRWERVSAQQALDDVLRTNGLVMIANPATTVVRFAPANLGINPVSASLVGSDTNGVLHTIGVVDEPLDETIKMIVEKRLHLKVTFDQVLSSRAADLKARISFRWEDITARQTLAALLDNYDLAMIEDAAHASVRITSRSK